MLFFSPNTDLTVRENMCSMLNAQIVTEFEKYLGLLIVGGKNKVNTFKNLQERIAKRGREVLIKTIAQAIPTYSMNLFKLPKGLCNDINSILAKYWWGKTNNEKKIHWINWKRLSNPKKKGGMGFQDINSFNLAMLAKQAWRLLNQKNSLFFRVYKARYFLACSFLETKLGSNPLYVWKSLLQAQEVILEVSKWKVGSGTSMDIANHRWLPQPPSFRRDGPWSTKVRELMDEVMGQWDRTKLAYWFVY